MCFTYAFSNKAWLRLKTKGFPPFYFLFSIAVSSLGVATYASRSSADDFSSKSARHLDGIFWLNRKKRNILIGEVQAMCFAYAFFKQFRVEVENQRFSAVLFSFFYRRFLARRSHLRLTLVSRRFLLETFLTGSFWRRG